MAYTPNYTEEDLAKAGIDIVATFLAVGVTFVVFILAYILFRWAKK